MKVKYFGSPLFGLGEFPSDEEVGVWWTQATFGDGLAEWCCPRCKKHGFGLSILLARVRFWWHFNYRCKRRPLI